MLKKELVVVVIVLLLGISVIPNVIGGNPSSGKTIYVDDDADPTWYDETHVKTIQEGIDIATMGCSIFVYAGVYYEHILVNKTVNLIGEHKDNTLLYFDADVDVVKITSDAVIISNFTIKNTKSKRAGVLCCSDDCVISKNVIQGHGYGVLVDVTDDNGAHDIDNTTIVENYISNNNNGIGTNAHTVFGWHCKNTEVMRNTFANNSFGIFLFWADSCNVHHNNFWENGRDAFFTNTDANWNCNFWNRPLFLPHLIFGLIVFLIFPYVIPLFQFDWHPAQEPYDISIPYV